MNKANLIDEINAYAIARAAGHPLLAQRQKEMLEAVLARLPDELPELKVAQTDHRDIGYVDP